MHGAARLQPPLLLPDDEALMAIVSKGFMFLPSDLYLSY